MQKLLIPYARSVIVSCDVPSGSACASLVQAVRGVRGIGGFKIGVEVGLNGFPAIGKVIKEAFGSETAVIYDHQKAGTDIPEMGAKFAKKVKEAGCDAAILFPFAGPKTQRAWTEACQGEGLRVIIGGVMTHPGFIHREGGYISDDAPDRIFAYACEQGVRDFVVPGTKLEWVKHLRARLSGVLGEGNYVLYAPGLVTQGGDISECGQAAGPYFHAIVGRDIYSKSSSQEIREAAIRSTSKLIA